MKYGLSGRGYGGVTKISRSFRTGELLPTHIKLDPPKLIKKKKNEPLIQKNRSVKEQNALNKTVFTPSCKYLFVIELEDGDIPGGEFTFIVVGYHLQSLPDDKVNYNVVLVLKNRSYLVKRAEITLDGDSCLIYGKGCRLVTLNEKAMGKYRFFDRYSTEGITIDRFIRK